MARGFRAEVDNKTAIRALRIIGNEALPEVVAQALNETADAVTTAALKNINKRLIVRTKFTTGSLMRRGAHPYKALNKARGRNVARMFSRAGTISPYLPLQETGGTVQARSSRIPIPTLAARRGQKRRRISSPYSMRNLGDLDGSGRFFMGVPKGGNRPLGIWERTNANKRLKLIRNLEKSTVWVPETNWYSDALRRYGTHQFIRSRFHRAANRRLRRYQPRGRTRRTR